MSTSLTILGGGNMGGAIARALVTNSAYRVSVIEPDTEKRAGFEMHGIATFPSLSDASATEILLIAIKPQQWQAMAETLSHTPKNAPPLVLSIMAGISIAALQQISPRVVRVMPNLPALIHESMSVLAAPAELTAHDRKIAEAVFASIGQTAWVESEEMLHAVTAISGSGPGFVYGFMEVLEKASINLGLNAALAKRLITQTLCGSALLARASEESYAQLRMQVTSKGGTTEAGLKALLTPAFHDAIEGAARAARDRSKALAEE